MTQWVRSFFFILFVSVYCECMADQRHKIHKIPIEWPVCQFVCVFDGFFFYPIHGLLCIYRCVDNETKPAHVNIAYALMYSIFSMHTQSHTHTHTTNIQYDSLATNTHRTNVRTQTPKRMYHNANMNNLRQTATRTIATNVDNRHGSLLKSVCGMMRTIIT